MCQFLTIGVQRAHAAQVAQVFHEHRINASSVVNPQVAALFWGDAALFLVTTGGCSCSIRRPSRDEASELITRLSRKGRTPRQIQQAVDANRPVEHPLWRALAEFDPVHVFFHTVQGDPLTDAVPTDAQARLLKNA